MRFFDTSPPVASLEFSGRVISADDVMFESASDLRSEGSSYVRFERDGSFHYGFIKVRFSGVTGGRWWAEALLYEVDARRRARHVRGYPRNGRAFRQSAELQLREA